MNPESQTPDGWPESCPECGERLKIEATHKVEENLQCNKCFALISFVRLKGSVYGYPATRRNWSKQMKANRLELSNIISEEMARAHRICPITTDGNIVSVVTTEADNDELREKLQFICNCQVHLIQADADMVDWMIEQQYEK